MSCGMEWTLTTLTVIAILLRPARSDGRGPYDVLFTSYEDCGKETALVNNDVRIVESAKNSVVISGVIVSNVTVTDQFKMKFGMHQFKNRAWIEDYMVLDQGTRGPCTTIKMAFSKDFIDSFTSRFIDQNNKTLTEYFDACYTPPGVYTFANIKFDWPGRKYYSEFAYGKFRSYVKLFSSEVEVSCLYVYYDVVPKKKKKSTG